MAGKKQKCGSLIIRQKMSALISELKRALFGTK